jgi:FMN phosphatase YigB (HAD superfamily)
VSNKVKVISFDMEGTLCTTDFSYCVWYEAIPTIYAKSRGLNFAEARKAVEAEYAIVGDQRAEWYDIGHWFKHFGLGDPDAALKASEYRITYFSEVRDVLESLR